MALQLSKYTTVSYSERPSVERGSAGSSSGRPVVFSNSWWENTTMRAVHFFKAKSRMGIINPYNHQKEYDNVGVENGSDAILTDDFLDKFQLSHISEYVFSKPEEIKHEQFNKILVKQVNGFREFINNHLKPGQIQVVIGGDHSVTLPSILATRDRIGGFKDLGYVQFDSHGDVNLKASSPTDNFHGMYARALIDNFDIPEIDELIPHKLPIKNILYVGNLDLDPGEMDLFHKKKIKNVDRSSLLKDKRRVVNDFKNFISSFRYLHVTFDIDVLNKIQAPATGLPSENGFMIEDIEELFSVISGHPNLSFDLTELNPQKFGKEQTVKSAQKVLLTSLLGRSG